MAEALRENSSLSQFIEARREGAVMSNYPDNFNSRAFDRRWGDASPRDMLDDRINAAFRKHFDALKADLEAICYEANVDMKTDIEAFEYFTDGCDNAFEIDTRMNSDE